MSNEKWCKIFDTEKHGQILIQLGSNDDGELNVRTTFECTMGQISLTVGIKECDDDIEKQARLFAHIDEATAIESVSKLMTEMGLI